MGPVSDGKADHVVVEEVGVIVAEIVLLAACFIGAIIWLWCILFMAKMNALEDEIRMEALVSGDLYSEGRVLMEAAALCEQRRHGRRLGGQVEVVWDGEMFPSKTTTVGDHAEWLSREGHKNGISVRRKNGDNSCGVV